MQTQRPYLTPSEAARYLAEQGVPHTRSTLDTWRCRGTGPRYCRIRNRVKYRPCDLDAWIESVTQPIETTDTFREKRHVV